MQTFTCAVYLTFYYLFILKIKGWGNVSTSCVASCRVVSGEAGRLCTGMIFHIYNRKLINIYILFIIYNVQSSWHICLYEKVHFGTLQIMYNKLISTLLHTCQVLCILCSSYRCFLFSTILRCCTHYLLILRFSFMLPLLN